MTSNGPPDKAVIFLHPAALDAQAGDWIGLDGLIAPSLPGHGERHRARPGLTLEDMADEIAGWTKGRVHLIGCSMGGMIALHFALRHPDKVASLFLAYTTSRVESATMQARADETERIGSLGMTAPTMSRWFTEGALAETPLRPAIAYAQTMLQQTPAAVIADDWRAISSHDVLERLPELAGLSTTCLAGRRDLSTPQAAVEAISAGIPGSRFVVADHPHMGFLEHPAEFVQLVRDHLDWARKATE